MIKTGVVLNADRKIKTTVLRTSPDKIEEKTNQAQEDGWTIQEIIVESSSKCFTYITHYEAGLTIQKLSGEYETMNSYLVVLCKYE